MLLSPRENGPPYLKGVPKILYDGCVLPFESKLLPAVLLLLRIYFLKITVTVTVLKFG